MNRTWIVILLVILAAPAAAERGVTPERAVAGGTNAFAVDLMKEVAKKPGNVFFSPYSLTTALAMVAEGARGETQDQMLDVLHLPKNVAASGSRALAEALRPGTVAERPGRDEKQVPAYEISIANRVWAQDGLGLVPDYVATLEGPFAAPVGRIDFTKSAEARRIINAWVAKKTKDRIENIVPEGLPTADTLLALANAIHFKAAWREPFPERATSAGTFTLADGDSVECDFMGRTGGYRYLATEDLEAVEIPYRAEASMIVILPREGVDLAGVEAGMTWPALNSLLGRLESQAVELRLPKFSFTWAKNLEDVLPKMGMRNAFAASLADFTGITIEEPLVIGPVLHKAFVAVDEKGTEAAAATVVLMKLGSASPGKPIPFHADRPFLFLIRHDETGTILFLGRVSDPTAD